MASIPDCTLTTACYFLQPYHSHARGMSETVESIEPLLRIPCYLVIYCNAVMEPILREKRGPFLSLTRFIIQEFEDLWCYSLLDQVKKNRDIYWPTRDRRTCAETHLLTCNKADFVLQTIQTNPFQTTKFGWIDSNIGVNASKISQQYGNHLLLHVLHNVTDKFHLQLLNVTDKKYKQAEWKREYYMEYRWVACGCLFTTTKAIGMTILNRIKDLIVETTYAGYGHGEEMFYLEILDEFYDDIHRSYGDYKDMLHNFIKPTTNFVYIYWSVVMRYFELGYWKECVEVCQKLIDQYDTFSLEINYDLYVRLYSAMYLSLVSLDPIRAEHVAHIIRRYYRTHPHFTQQFDNLRSICGMNHFSTS
jgi:hypothetical protein